MIAEEFIVNVGDNVVTIALALITLGTVIFTGRNSAKAARAAESANAQLKNNGGSTALDKLETGHRLILARLDDIDCRLDSHDTQLTRLGGAA